MYLAVSYESSIYLHLYLFIFQSLCIDIVIFKGVNVWQFSVLLVSKFIFMLTQS